MTKRKKEVLNGLSKEQLIYLIEQLLHSQFLISETCIEKSKWEIDSDKAVDEIRKYIYRMPNLYDVTLKDYLNMKMGKISGNEYRKRILGSDEECES